MIISRLCEAMIAAGVPRGKFWINMNDLEDPATITYKKYADDVTPEHQAAGEAVIASFDFSQAAETAAQNVELRALATAAIEGKRDEVVRLLVAAFLTMVEETNRLRKRLRDQDQVIANFTTTANLKSSWAAVVAAAPMADVSNGTAKTQIGNKLSSGEADAT